MRATTNIILPPPLPKKVGPRMRGPQKHLWQLRYCIENWKDLTEVEYDFIAKVGMQKRFSQSDKDTLEMIAVEVYERILGRD